MARCLVFLHALTMWHYEVASVQINKFPVQGFDYLTGDFKSQVFSTALGPDPRSVVLRSKSHEIPESVDTVTPTTECSLGASSKIFYSLQELKSETANTYSKKWSESIEMQGTLESKAGGSATVKIGYEVGGSGESSIGFVRSSMMTTASTVIKTDAKCEFAQVIMREPHKAFYSQDFLDKLALLPNIELNGWDSALKGDRRQYKSLLDTYGTHYVHTAKLGGAYEGTLSIETCDMLRESKTANDYQQCTTSKFTAAVEASGGGWGGRPSGGQCGLHQREKRVRRDHVRQQLVVGL